MSRLLDNIERPQRLSLIASSDFSDIHVEHEIDDPLADLLGEFDDFVLPEEKTLEIQTPATFQLSSRDDQLLPTLEGQLGFLRESLARLHFYLTDLDDSIRR